MSEKKYEVEFLNNDDGRFLLFGGLANYHECFIEQEENNEGYWQQYFTEQEIKSIDERYWQFAVPVEDGVMGYELELDDLAQSLAESGININDLNLIEVEE